MAFGYPSDDQNREPTDNVAALWPADGSQRGRLTTSGRVPGRDVFAVRTPCTKIEEAIHWGNHRTAERLSGKVSRRGEGWQ